MGNYVQVPISPLLVNWDLPTPPVAENPVSRALARASTLDNCASLEFIFLEETEEPDTPSGWLARSH